MSERCDWCKDNGILQKYHDEEWGIPLHDDRKQFEFLMMEVMQCGLNWNMMLKKRHIFRQCFDDFDYRKIAKIQAVINNACRFRQIIEEFGSFDTYLWSWTGGKILLPCTPICRQMTMMRIAFCMMRYVGDIRWNTGNKIFTIGEIDTHISMH